MNDWFTVEKIDCDTYVISEYRHWEETHCYLLIGAEKALLIDTGLGVSNIKTVVDEITELPLEIVTTHVHWDHIGGHKFFRNISVYETEKEWLSSKFPIPLQVVKNNLIKKPCDFPIDFDITKYQLFQGEPERILYDGDLFDLGKRTVQVIHTPGHSPGHICLYELERNYLYSGDLIYKGILYAFYPTTDPIEFMKSVKKVRKLNIEKILPAHYTLDIPKTLINEIDDGFTEIFNSGKLKQGNGIFKFTNFQIYI
ncbi:MAG: MBL fold metallo-hydrolase [Clostridiaceae bacterium]|nr:MBL fold metallo-hydrolase [Clostridiaceae bacterium]MBW4859413.1 MBL fold metallo-hydrolase [Clostridiaceae bacterium]MBW4867259.1 MBL fold metallo-hydrolase [Clostridiaceae bacterium]